MASPDFEELKTQLIANFPSFRWSTGDGISEEARELFLLLGWALFSPLHSGSDFKFNFEQVFNSQLPIMKKRGTCKPVYEQILPSLIAAVTKRRPIEHPQYNLRFSLLQSLLAIDERTIETTEYMQLYNSLMSATHSSYLFNSKEFGPHGTDEAEAKAGMLSSCSKILPQAQQKALLLLGPTGSHRFIHLSLSCLTTRWYYSSILGFSKEYRSVLRISYNSNIGGLWKITSYSPLLAIETTSPSPIAEGHLHRALKCHMLHCIFQFGHAINVSPDWIEVSLQMDNIRCDVSPMDGENMDIPYALLNERHFPAKISLTIGPENGCHSISLTRSSQNPITEIGKGNAYELTFEPPKNVGLKASSATTSTVKINNWGFEQSVVNGSDAKMEWTLYDTTTQNAVINNGPPKFSVFGPKTWSTDRFSWACRAFTAEGGVVFTKRDYGDPIIWRFDRQLEGRTLKWIIQGSVWLTYWPNTYHTRYSETKRLDFRQELDLTLVQSSHPKPLEYFM